MKKFYLTYKDGYTLCNQLSWSHNRLIMNIDDENKRNFYLEETIKKEIAKKVKRGKIDVFVTFENNSLEGKEIKINTELAKAYIDELKKFL